MGRRIVTRRTFLGTLITTGLSWMGINIMSAQEETPEPETTDEPQESVIGQVWNIPEMAEEQTRSFDEFFRIPAMSMGIYKLEAGSVDRQSPHEEDEAYYVVSGRATIEIDGEDTPVETGSLIFVAAHAQHRFKDIEEDLDLLVFFAPAFNS